MRLGYRKLLRFGLLTAGLAVLVAIGLGQLGGGRALADDCLVQGANWYGEGCWRGYFNSANTSQSGQDVIMGGITVNSKQDFINQITNLMNCGSRFCSGGSTEPNRTGGRFIILTMLGLQHGRPNSVSPDQYNDWVNRVNSADMVVENIYFPCGSLNSYYQFANDVAASSATGGDNCGTGNMMIDFYANGQLVYRIREACGNPLGNLPGLPQGHPPLVYDQLACQPDGHLAVTGRAWDPDSPTTVLRLDASPDGPWGSGSADFVGYSQPSNNDNFTILMSTPYSTSWHEYWIYVNGVNSAGQFDQQYPQAIYWGGNCPQPPTDALPALTAAGTCTTATTTGKISGNAQDPDDKLAKLRINIYENGTRQYTMLTDASHNYSVNVDSVIAGNVGSGGKGPTGASVGLHAQNFAVRAMSVDSNGNPVSGAYKEATLSIGPCVTTACAGTTLPATFMIAGVKQTYQAKITMNYPYTNPYSTGPPEIPAMHTHIVAPDNTTITFDGQSPGIVAPGYTVLNATSNSPTLITKPLTFTPTQTGTYTIWWSLDAAFGHPFTQCQAQEDSKYSPYFSVLGGDIAAGPGFEDLSSVNPTTCSTNAGAGLEGQNTGAPNYSGAGSQLGAMVMGQIRNFATAEPWNGVGPAGGFPTPTQPTGFSFANANNGGRVNSATGMYGGGFDYTNWCLPDYAGMAAAVNGVHDVSGASISGVLAGGVLSNGVNVYSNASGTLIFNPASVGTHGHDHIILVVRAAQSATDLQVVIKQPVTYDRTYNSVDTIPQFQLIVQGGDILVDNTVGELDGVYTAQPKSDGTRGGFYTCAVSGLGNTYTTSTAYSDCAPPVSPALKIYGAVSAAHVYLGRSKGNVVPVGATVPGTPAEQIIYSPELWLGNVPTGRSGGSMTTVSETSLPPQL